jgi:hypothetical protein
MAIVASSKATTVGEIAREIYDTHFVKGIYFVPPNASPRESDRLRGQLSAIEVFLNVLCETITSYGMDGEVLGDVVVPK